MVPKESLPWQAEQAVQPAVTPQLGGQDSRKNQLRATEPMQGRECSWVFCSYSAISAYPGSKEVQSKLQA